MTLTRIPQIENIQIHFYIITQIKNFISNTLLSGCAKHDCNTPQYKNISLLLHSYCTAIFNIEIVYSNLHESMEVIFEKNNIKVTNIENERDEITIKHRESCDFCIRDVKHKIIPTIEFKKLWHGDNKPKDIKITKNGEYVMSYRLPNTLQNTNTNIYKLKYLKYKTKYFALKNK